MNLRNAIARFSIRSAVLLAIVVGMVLPAVVMLVVSFGLLLGINGLQAWTKKTREAV